jgi:predicted DNA-binding protein
MGYKMNKEEEKVKFTLYLTKELNDPIEWIRFKTRKPKNQIVREALEDYLPKQLKKYPGFEGSK